ncbi:PEP/pyruvate-binding domain-containing protein [Klebsiella pneumoniae]
MILSIEKINQEKTGGKFYNLKLLKKNKIKTVRGFYIDKSEFDVQLKSVLQEIFEYAKVQTMDSIESITDISKFAHDKINSIDLDSKFENEIKKSLSKLSSVQYFAVRSSMVGTDDVNSEDSVSHAFAGMSDTYLYVPPSDVIRHIKKCWASGFNVESLLYRIKNNIPAFDFSVSVGIQEMIDAQKSFVMFNIDPVTYKDNLIISCCYGVGEGVVQDKAESDLFIVKNNQGEIDFQSKINEKKHLVTKNHEKNIGTNIYEIDNPYIINTPILDADEIKKLTDIAEKIESIFGIPQDIEGCVDKNGDIYILQARPINTEEPVFFHSNYNLTENYPGHSKFLTYSFSRVFYSALLTDCYNKIGLPDKKIHLKMFNINNVLSYFNGGIYYNINNFIEAHRDIFNSISFMKSEWEKRIALPVSIRDLSKDKTPYIEKLKIRLHLISNVFLIGHRDKKFKRWWNNAIDKTEKKSAEMELISLNRFMSDLYNQWGWTITSGLTLICLNYYVRKIAKHFDINEDEFNRMLSVAPTLKSVDVLKSFMCIVKDINSNQEALEIFKNKEPTEIIKLLSINKNIINIKIMIDKHLFDYGARGLQELKLETKSYRMFPEELIKRLKVSINSGFNHYPDQITSSQTDFISVGKLYYKIPFLYRPLFKILMNKTLSFIKLREDTRYLRSEIFDYAKHVIAKVSDTLVSRDLISEGDDVFFLSYEEINAAMLGQLSPSVIKNLVNSRSYEFNNNINKENYSAFFCKEGIIIPNAIIETKLSGIGSSYGVARGYVKVIEDPNNIRNINKNTILVTRETDPAWLFLMISSCGIIVEKGSILSHTAITGRKLGIPTIVGVTDCTKILRDGQYIEINGGTGNINILDDKGSIEETLK